MHLTATNNSFAWRFKQDWIETVSRFAADAGRDWRGAKVLEVGAGVHNPLGGALESLARGAALAAGVEPGGILPEHLDHAILLGLIAEHWADARHPGLREALDLLMSRVGGERSRPGHGWAIRSAALQLFCGTVQDYAPDDRFDIVHSNAVLEHILNLESACARLYDLTVPGGVHIHKVDFIDHRYYEKPQPQNEDAFRFLLAGQESKLLECNGLRMSEVIETFTGSGFEFFGAPESWQLPFPNRFLQQLQPRYRNLPYNDLETTCATLIFRKPASRGVAA